MKFILFFLLVIYWMTLCELVHGHNRPPPKGKGAKKVAASPEVLTKNTETGEEEGVAGKETIGLKATKEEEKPNADTTITTTTTKQGEGVVDTTATSTDNDKMAELEKKQQEAKEKEKEQQNNNNDSNKDKKEKLVPGAKPGELVKGEAYCNVISNTPKTDIDGVKKKLLEDGSAKKTDNGYYIITSGKAAVVTTPPEDVENDDPLPYANLREIVDLIINKCENYTEDGNEGDEKYSGIFVFDDERISPVCITSESEYDDC
ncbi:hypothetical protein BJ944DRAFT_261915 [Cunninghamella echinulata]|nr:hypothetical protein BJ944DRAFT_261915 [Cunninghamella echinulata]